MIRRLSSEAVFYAKLADTSVQKRRLLQLGPKCEVSRALGEVVSTESGRSPERAKAVWGRSEDLSPRSMC